MDAQFIKSCTDAGQLVDSDLPEVAVAGRSNCGKSSLINALSGRRGLARTSGTPGRTRELVLFSLSWSGFPFHLVDLPGYGYAKVSRAERALWGKLVPHYVETREQLRLMLVLSDIRRDTSEEEAALLSWCADRGISSWLVLTKADKLNKSQRFSAAAKARSALGLDSAPIVVSSARKDGIEPLRGSILKALQG